MSSDSKSWKFGIIGWPLGYSLSPLMHTAALKAVGFKGEYREIPVRPEDLNRWLEEEAPKLDGFNVTMPHKEAVYRWIEEKGEIVKPGLTSYIRAVNTVKVEGDHLAGSDTDGDGFLAPLSNHSMLKGKRVLLLGAGGAARAIAVYVATMGKIQTLTIWNRHEGRADELGKIVSAFEPLIRCEVRTVASLSEPEAVTVDVIVNATPMGMASQEEVSAELLERLHKGQVVYDIVYEPRETKLVREARKRGCTVITGDEMLAAQGALAFEIWTGVPVAKVFPAMSGALRKHFDVHAS